MSQFFIIFAIRQRTKAARDGKRQTFQAHSIKAETVKNLLDGLIVEPGIPLYRCHSPRPTQPPTLNGMRN